MSLLLQYTLIFASVLILVALGGCFSEHSGVINLGLEGIMIMGALGGARLEHTLANLATGLYLAKNGVSVLLADERSELRFLTPGRALVLAHHDWKFLSLFPMEGTLTGVCLRGVYYPLEDAVLTAEYPLGVSNEFTADTAFLQCSSGCGVVVLTRDDA